MTHRDSHEHENTKYFHTKESVIKDKLFGFFLSKVALDREGKERIGKERKGRIGRLCIFNANFG